jgi:hypothetical protein
MPRKLMELYCSGNERLMLYQGLLAGKEAKKSLKQKNSQGRVRPWEFSNH